jgi:hypothetical protein
LRLGSFTNVELVSLSQVSIKIFRNKLWHLPFIVNRFDNETQSRADSVNIFAHDLLDYGCLPSIIKATTEIVSSSLQYAAGFLTA